MSRITKTFALASRTLAQHNHGAGSTAEAGSPPGSMFLHMSLNEYFLFENWVPQTALAYYGALAAVFAVSLTTQAIGQVKRMRSAKRAVSSISSISSRLERSVLHTTHALLQYMLMLLFMTFNYGVCAAILAGHAVGSFVWDDHQIYSFLSDNGGNSSDKRD